MTQLYDHIVVGAGSAGCVLANRLSADPAVRVLLLEAGEVYPPDGEPEDVRDVYPLSSYNPGYFWTGMQAHWRDRAHGAPVSFPLARVAGGGSAVAGMVAFRGTSDDYDEWEQAGARGWSWSDVLPYFERLETDLDFTGPGHGSAGPMPIRRIPEALWPPLTKAISSFAQVNAMPFVKDMNLDFREGFGATPISSAPERRFTTAAGYLTAAVRTRPNLTIVPRALAQGIQFEGLRATGVSALVDRKTSFWRAREVILAAGAIHSPTLLMRSGVGGGSALQEHGVAVVAHRPGVGRNLQNHAALFVGAILRAGARQSSSLHTHPTACLRYSSNVPGQHNSDLYLNIQSKTSWNAMGLRLASLNAVLLKPRGSGSVTLRSAGPDDKPLIEFGFGQHDGDMLSLAAAMKTILDIVYSPQVSPLIGRPFLVRVGDRIRKWNSNSPGNASKARAMALLLDCLPGSVADRLIARMTGSSVDLRSLRDDSHGLLELVKREVSGVYHPVGTCRMGAEEDPHAVVDPQGRVYGTQGLRVVDASIMPSVPRGNTNIPTIMVAEKVAAMMGQT